MYQIDCTIDLFSSFSCMFLNPNNFLYLNSNCSHLLDTRNLQEQVKNLEEIQNQTAIGKIEKRSKYRKKIERSKKDRKIEEDRKIEKD